MQRPLKQRSPGADNQPHEDAVSSDDASVAQTTTLEPLNPHSLTREELERKIRGARRRSRMPGKDGKQGAKDLLIFKSVHRKRFPGTIIRDWDSLPPPPPNRQKT